MASKSVDQFPGTRITLTTVATYDDVLSKLASQIGSEGVSKDVLQHLFQTGRQAFEDYFNKAVGSAGFIRFWDLDHSNWITLFGAGGGLRVQRVILGNPLIAITMMRHAVDAGLYVPVELLVRETLGSGGGQKVTQVAYILPSSLIATLDANNQDLFKAAQALDEKLECLVKQITA